MLSKSLVISLLLCSAAYSAEIDKEKFHKMLDEEIWKIESFKRLLTDSSDIYTYYYMMGKEAAIMEARRAIEECEVRLLLSQQSTPSHHPY